MSGQVTLFQTSVQVFEDGSVERGAASCALVGQSGVPPRYKIVCFNDQRQSICTATLTGSNEHSLQFQLQTAEYACFRSDDGTAYSILFMRSADVDLFVAYLACAFYGASSQPTHSTVIADLAHASKRDRSAGNEVLELGRRGKVSYTCFRVTRGATTADLPTLDEKPLETSGDTAYIVEAVQSAFSLPKDGKGFEASVVGMITDTTRLIVVPQAMPRSSSVPDHTLAFIVHLKRVVADPAADVTGALVNARALALVNNSSEHAKNALVLSNAAVDDGPPRPKTFDPHAPGSGIPAEHMLLVQKIGAQINTAMSTMRDLGDKVEMLSNDWKQIVNRPKPSVLTNSALEQNVRNLINENEKVRDELTRREELIHALEARNRDLQKRVDKLAVDAQELLRLKQNATSKASDMRLEMDRQLLRLREQITQATNERDDVHRHLTTVKKLLDMSDEQLRDTKGRFEIVQVQVRGTTDKLDALEEQLGEERSRRKAYEAKVAAMQEEIRNALAEARLKSAELDDVNRKADADRIYHAQLMEDERQRRSIDVAQLRSEIVTELQNREAKFQADRARTASDNFERGREEGIDIGRRNARIDIEHRMQELQLEAQRCRTELDAYKTQLRDTQEDAMSENRRLEAAVAALKRSIEDATKQKAQNEFAIHSLRLRVKHAEDALLLGISAFVNRLSRVIEPTDLLESISALHKGETVNIAAFEIPSARSEEEEIRRRRIDAMFDEALAVYTEDNEQTFKDWFDPCDRAFNDLNTEISRLWYEREMKNIDEIMTAEASCRSGIDIECDSSYSEICARWRREAVERSEVEREEAEARTALDIESESFFQWITALLIEQRASRDNIIMACDVNYEGLIESEADEFRSLRRDFERVVFEKIIAEQEQLMGEEDQARIGLHDDESREFDDTRSAAAAELSSLRSLQAEREKALRAARAEIESEESQARVGIEVEEEAVMESFLSDVKAVNIAYAQATTQVAKSAAPETVQHPPSAAPAAKPAAKRGPIKVTDSDVETPRDFEPVVARAAPQGAHKLSAQSKISNPLGDLAATATADSDSHDEDEERPTVIPNRRAPVTGPVASSTAAALFDSGSDTEPPAPTFKPAAKVVAKAAPAKSTLFDSDSDDQTPRQPATKSPRPPMMGRKAAPKPAPKGLGASESD